MRAIRTYRSLLRSTAIELVILWVAAGAMPLRADDFAVGSELMSLARPCLRLRSGPKTSAPVQRCLDHGRKMNLLVSEGNWGRVRLSDGDEGWVLLKLVKAGDDRSVASEADSSPGLSAAGAAASLELQRQIGKLEAALELAQASRDEWTGERIVFQRRLDELESALETAQAELAALKTAQTTNADLERQLSDLEVALDSAQEAAQAEKQRDREVLTTALAERADLESRLRDSEAALAAKQTQFEGLVATQVENADLERRLRDSEAALASAHTEAREEARRNRDVLEFVLAEKMDLESRLRDAEAALEAQQTQFDDRCANAESAVAAELAAAQAENLNLERTVETFENAAEGDAARIADLTGRLRAAEIFFEESSKQRLELNEQLAAFRRDNEELRKQAAAKEIEMRSPVESKPSSAPTVEQPAAPPLASELWAIVQDWAKAWSDGRIEDYLAFYVGDFSPEGLTRNQWMSQRRARLSKPSIQVDVAFLDMRFEAPDRPEVEFVQSYSSGTFEDVVVKTLGLMREADAWKISSERVK